MRIACIGEVMLELTLLDDGVARTSVAGDAYNTAVYMRRWLDKPQASISFITGIGSDAVSGRVLDALRSEAIDHSAVERRTDRTIGLYTISNDSSGERSFTYWRSNSAARLVFGPSSSLTLDRLFNFDLIYLSGITLAILPQGVREQLYGWAKRYRRNGGKIAFDSNYRPVLWGEAQIARAETMRMWGLCDIALPSLSDEMNLFGDADEDAVLGRLASVGAVQGCLKRGERGPLSLKGEPFAWSAAAPHEVVDTTAAGDSFNAGYLAAFVQGLQPIDCMAAGHTLAGHVIRHRGAICPPDINPPAPWWREAGAVI